MTLPKLFPHQEKVSDLVQTNDIGIFEITCGGGKTLAMMLASQHFPISVVLAPTKNLVSQILDNFKLLKGTVSFAVNSDNPVDVDVIEEAKDSGKRIVFICNYQSMHVLADLCSQIGIVVNVKFLDEAHNITSEKKRNTLRNSNEEDNDDIDMDDDDDTSDDGYDYEDTISSSDDDESVENDDTVHSADMVDLSVVKSKKTFSFTATPNKTMLSHPEIYGKVLLRYTYAQGVIDGHVKNVDTVIECYGSDISCLSAGYDRLIPAVSRFITAGAFKRVIVYTSRVKNYDTKRASVDGLYVHRYLFPADYKVLTVTASTSPQCRNEIFNKFRSTNPDVQVILSCMTISEGIDLPNCDAVVILDPSKSVVKVVQRTLRACRLTGEERMVRTWSNAAVFYPINVPEKSFMELISSGCDEDGKAVINKHVHRHEFEFAMAVVHFLKQDLGLDILFEYTSKKKSFKPSQEKNESLNKDDLRTSSIKSKKPIANVTFQLEGNVDWSTEYFQDTVDYLSTTMHVTSLEESFNRNLMLLRDFVTEHDRLPSHGAKDPTEKKLASWCSTQRKTNKNGKISEEKIEALAGIPCWDWDPLTDEFNRNIALLRDFVAKHDRLPSTIEKDATEQKLGSWCNARRQEKKKQKLSEEKTKALNDIPRWEWDPLADEFNRNIASLRKFVTENDRIPSQEAKNATEKKLGRWCNSRRQDNKHEKLSEDKIKALNDIPRWTFYPLSYEFDHNIALLRDFVTEHARLPSNKAKDPTEKKLGKWCSHRRQENKNEKLSEENIKALNDIPRWTFDPLTDEFDRNIALLCDFVTEHDRLPVEKAKYATENKLGSWCAHRRQDNKKGKLSEEKIEALARIPRWEWDPVTDEFNRNIALMRKFVTDHDSLPSTAAKDATEKKLGIWCSTQRKAKKKGNISEERIKALDDIPRWTFDIFADEFDRNIVLLREFITEHDRLPSQTAKDVTERKLGTWCSRQRKEKKKETLPKEKIESLDGIPSWDWDPLSDEFDRSLESLRDFVTENVRLPSKHAKDATEKKLGYWCCSRRQDNKTDKLSEEKIKALNDIPRWEWNPLSDEFDRNIASLREFVTEHYRLPSQSGTDSTEKKLGVWCNNRRQEKKKGKLSEEKTQALNDIPCWTFDPITDEFDRNMAILREFVTEHYRLPSEKAKDATEKKLGSWCSVRRKDNRKGKLTEERIKTLEEINHWYWSLQSISKSTKLTLNTTTAPSVENTKKRKRELSTLSEYHKRFKSMSSANLHNEFQDEPDLFKTYHQVADMNWSTFKTEDVPVQQAANIVNKFYTQVGRNLNITDFGAGTGKLKELIDPIHTLTGFDHVSTCDWIVAKDMRETGLADCSQDICVFSMSLWGSNWEDYITEASRVLKVNGYIIVINKSRKWFLDDEDKPLDHKDTRIGKAVINAGLVITNMTGLDTIFATCVAFKPFRM